MNFRSVPVIVVPYIECPLSSLNIEEFLKNDRKFPVSLSFHSNSTLNTIIKVDFCYEHVKNVDDVVGIRF